MRSFVMKRNASHGQVYRVKEENDSIKEFEERVKE